MTLKEAEVGIEYIVKSIETFDDELNTFLFSLGCYEGQTITVIRSLRGAFVVAIKDARYTIDKELAEAIKI